MSVQSVPVNVEKEVMDALNAVVNLVAAIKSKMPIEQIIASELATLISVMGELSAIPADVVGDPAGSAMAVAVAVTNLVQVLKS